MNTPVEKSAVSVESLEGMLENPIFQGVTPITKEEEDLTRESIRKNLEKKDSSKFGDILGKLLPYEKAFLVRMMVLRTEMDKQKSKVHPLKVMLGAALGEQDQSDFIAKLRQMSERVDQLRYIFWSMLHERFAEIVKSENVAGLMIDQDFQVLVAVGNEEDEEGPCPICGEYHS